MQQRKIFLILAVFILLGTTLLFGTTISPFSKGTDLYVHALSGLNLRKGPDSSAEKIMTISYAEKVAVTKVTEKRFISGAVEGYWVEVSYNGKKGYLFDGFLSVLPAPKEGEAFFLEKYTETYLSLSAAKKNGLSKFKLVPRISKDSSEISSTTTLALKNIRFAEAFHLARNIAAANDWWFSSKDGFPEKSTNYKEEFKQKDGQNFKLDVEVSVKKENGTISSIYIRKDWDGYVRFLEVEKKNDAVEISFTVLD